MDVGQVAKLAHLDLSEVERATFQKQLGSILSYMRQLEELNLAGIEPTSHGQVVCNVFREDVAHPGLAREVALANAPERIGDEFKVPKIVE